MTSMNLSDAQKTEEVKAAVNAAFQGWFCLDKIHFIERRALPEFFDGKSVSKNPKVYKEYRNFIVKSYMGNPQRSLTYSEVRKMLLGDVNLIRKVFDYAEYWGLINNHTSLENKPQMATPDSASAAPISGNVPAGIRIVYPCKIVHPKGQAAASERPAAASNIASHKDLFMVSSAETVPHVPFNESIDNLTMQSCSNCGVHNQSNWFRNKDKAGFILCEACFSAGDGYFKDDFILTKTSDRSDDTGLAWTKEEMRRLLDAIAKHGENWDRVAIHVGTKSKAECIMYFMKLPFGDQFCVGSPVLESLASSKDRRESMVKNQKAERRNSSVCGEALQAPDSDELLESIEDADEPPTKLRRLNVPPVSSNPILDQVALLSAAVAPRIAAVAAQAALMAISEEDPVATQFLSSAQLTVKDSLPITAATTGKETWKADEEQKEGIVTRSEENLPSSRAFEVEKASSRDHLPSTTQIRAAIATAIGAVAANAKLLADQEERETEYLMATVLESQLKKLESKVQHFEELKHLLEVEHTCLERTQREVLSDLIHLSNFNYSTGPA